MFSISSLYKISTNNNQVFSFVNQGSINRLAIPYFINLILFLPSAARYKEGKKTRPRGCPVFSMVTYWLIMLGCITQACGVL